MLNNMFLSIGLASLLLASTNAFAADKVTSAVWVNYTQAEENSSAYSLDLDIGIDLDNSLLLGISQSENDLRGETIETNSYLLGYNSFSQAPWATNIFYEYWGKRRELVIESVGFELNYLTADWNAGMEFEYREIDFYSRELMIGQRHYKVDSLGAGFRMGLSSGQLSWSLNGKWYDYSENIQRLNTDRGIFILGLKNLSHVSSLNKWAAVTQLYYRFNSSGLGLSYSHAVAELDGAASDTVALLLDVKVTDVFSIATELGRTFGEQGVTTSYGSLGLGFRF